MKYIDRRYISDEMIRKSKEGQWIGVDLDGTMYTYTEWVGWNVFGEPIQPMHDRVRAFLNAGIQVRIVTARIAIPLGEMENGWRYNRVARWQCRVSKQWYSDHMMRSAIQDRLVQDGFPMLEIQPHKESGMMMLFDDRAVQVVSNTGVTLEEKMELLDKMVASASSHPGF